MNNDERYEISTMNRPSIVPRLPEPVPALRALFLLLVVTLFLLNLQSARSQEGTPGPSQADSFGLLPHHIDRGIDRLALDSLTRSTIDSLRSGYRTEREETQEEIARLREQMLQQLNAQDRSGLDTTRQLVRTLMQADRDASDTYGRSVALLLQPDQLSLLLDMDFVWGEAPTESAPADSARSTAEAEVAVDQPAAPVVREVPFRTGVVVSDPVRTGTGQVRREPATP